MITKNELKKNTINNLLAMNNNSKFIIPEYQRLYVWDNDKASKLFSDIWEFTLKQKDINKTEDTYFLGSLVACENRHNIEIVDGQQRVTSLFLLLRAIYTRLAAEESNDKTKNLMNRIAPALWEVDKKTNNPDYEKPLLESKVIDDDDKDILKNILKTGIASTNNKDNYSKNYLLYLDLYDEKSRENRHKLDDFIILLLDSTVLLPIITDKEDIALTIFSTLNDRGMPLTSADKFKAEIYKKLPKAKRKDFIEQWKDLESDISKFKDSSMQTLFYYYMFYIRAKNGDNSGTTPGLNDFFLEDNINELYNDKLLDNLQTILDFITVLENRTADEKLSWSSNIKILKALDILYEYPNEFWKYPVITYYLKYNKKKDFENRFIAFLNNLIVLLIVRYLDNPSTNGVKPDIVKLDVDIINSIHPQFPDLVIVDEEIRKKLITPNPKLVRMLLTSLAYSETKQKALLEDRKWEIEHILPQKWQPNYFPKDMNDDQIKAIIEHLGNKTPIKKRLNIVAGNNYIDKKTPYYKESNIVMTNNLKELKEWSFEDINLRDGDVTNKILNTIKKHIKSYNKQN